MKKLYGNKICITFFLLLTLFLLSTQSELSKAATFNVPGDFATIQEAIDDPGTINGDTINVLAGTFVEASIIITKELIIQGQGIGSTIMDPSSIGGFTIVFRPQADNITIRDMTIENASQAIRFELPGDTIDNTDIVRVSMLNNTSRGIELGSNTTVTNLLVDECNIESSGIGFRISSTGHLDGATFEDSTFTTLNMAIYVANDGNTSTMANVLITRNTFTDISTAHGSQGTAIYMEEVQDTRIQDNMFVNNTRDIQILKWYQASVPVSDVIIRRNTMIGTTDSVFALFNADNVNSGQTVFNNISFIRNNAMTNDASAVFAGAHSSFQSANPSMGGLGWDTVRIRNNCFTGITTAGNGVRYFLPTGITPDQALGGATLNAQRNWWGTADLLTITALLQVPSITDVTPIQTTDTCDPNFLNQQPLLPSYPGFLNRMSITGGIPNGEVTFVYGFEEGFSDASAICEDAEIEMGEFFILGTVTADDTGNSSLHVIVPPGFLGLSTFIQAIDMTTCVETDLNSETFTEPGTSITHLPITPGNAGEVNSIASIKAVPDGSVTYVYGFTPGTSDGSSICPGLQIDMAEFFLLTTATADQFGSSFFNVFVPAGFAGITTLLQAVDLTSCTASIVESVTF